MSERKRYPSDLTDGRWALIEPVITTWKAAHPSVSGHPALHALDQEAEHLRITRKTVLALADEPDPQPQAAVPEHPAYQQILAAFAEIQKPLRARDLCQALDLAIIPKNIESTRHKLKRLVSRDILAEPEPGLFTQPRP